MHLARCAAQSDLALTDLLEESFALGFEPFRHLDIACGHIHSLRGRFSRFGYNGCIIRACVRFLFGHSAQLCAKCFGVQRRIDL